jgi:elongator complex protein 3
LPEIAGNAMIREVHVYGAALGIGAESEWPAPACRARRTRLLDAARAISRDAGFARLSVIAATGTQGYYAARGFAAGDLYMTAGL